MIYNGCTYEYIYCYGMLNGFHCIAISEIDVVYDPPLCTGASFESNMQSITDSILVHIGLEPDILNFLGLEGVPKCPSGLMCMLRLYDAICYNGWYTYTRLNKDGTITFIQLMDKCDDEVRSCNEIVTICYDEILKEYVVTRIGSSLSGPPCTWPCHTNCEY
ncbi:MAG: hypothetical protein GX121_01780 [Ignavibacteria bacterium]|nr:hypothetical protein [Ignavibacteria bacterium]